MNRCNSTGFKSAVKLFNSMLTNNDTLRRVVQAELNLQPRSSACWTAQLLSAFQRLRGCELMYELFKLGMLLPCKSLLQIWLKHRMRGVWRDAELVDPNSHNNKSAAYHFDLPSLFLKMMSVCRIMYHGISILICPNMLCAI
jgi:hypothetical protein